MHNFISILVMQVVLLFAIVKADLGFVNMSNSVSSLTVEECADFNPNFMGYPTHLDSTTKGSKVFDIYPDSGCTSPKDPDLYKGRIIIMKRHPNCTFAERARITQKAGGNGILVVSETGLITPSANQTDYDEVDITVALITSESYSNLHRMIKLEGKDNVFIQQYAPLSNYYDPNSLIMWLLAVFTCSFGAWVQAAHYASQVNADKKTPKPSSGKESKRDEGSDELNVSVTHAIVFFGMCSVSILLMYYFYDYLVYVIIGIFCFASCLSTFDLLSNVFNTSSCFTRHRIPPNRIPFLSSRPPILAVVLFSCCAAFAVFWAVNRKEPYAWILQDILGFTFCVHMIKQIRLPSYKVSCILLILFFAYDIFYVFITPLLTKNKESIMVHIATGGSGATKEQLPMLFKLPRFLYSPYSKCGPMPYSMLGYGDIILPGLHVGFCAVWDFRISNTVRRHAYFLAAVIGYGTGLILTFVGMYLMMMGQPALLYLSPCCLLSTLIVALKRKELKAIWNGKVPAKSQIAPSPSANAHRSEQESLLEKAEI